MKQILLFTLLFFNFLLFAFDEMYILEKGKGELEGHLVICVGEVVVLQNPEGGMIQLYKYKGNPPRPWNCSEYKSNLGD